jgi:PEP-CTERM motif-containing protein
VLNRWVVTYVGCGPTLRFLLKLLVAATCMWSSSAVAHSCSIITSKGTGTICSAEDRPQQLSLAVSLTGSSFAAKPQQLVLIYDDATHTLLRDVAVASANPTIDRLLTLFFATRADRGSALAQRSPILDRFAMDNGSSVRGSLGDSRSRDLQSCGDISDDFGCVSGPVSTSFSVGRFTIPEPSTLILVGSGLITSGLWVRRGRRTRKHDRD